MKKQNIYAIAGLRALQRAALKVAENARKNNYKIPVWENDHIKYEIPEPVFAQNNYGDNPADVFSKTMQEVNK
jgi:hypothetical protein